MLIRIVVILTLCVASVWGMYGFNGAGAGAGAGAVPAITHELEQHAMLLTGSGGGKSTDLVNRLIRNFGWREKFGRVLLCASTCILNLPVFQTLEEYVNLLRNLPPTVKFNPYWVLLLLMQFGPLWLSKWIEVTNAFLSRMHANYNYISRLQVYTDEEAFWDRISQLCATCRESEETLFERAWDALRTCAVFDDADTTESSPLCAIAKDCRHITREHMVFLILTQFYKCARGGGMGIASSVR